jgi:hypothetical protein
VISFLDMKKDDNIIEYNPNTIRKLVFEVDSDNIEINRWVSVMDCALKMGFENGKYK